MPSTMRRGGRSGNGSNRQVLLTRLKELMIKLDPCMLCGVGQICVWVCGCVGVWVCGCVCVCVCVCLLQACALQDVRYRTPLTVRTVFYELHVITILEDRDLP